MPPSEAPITVSIVIPTWQRRELVVRLLELLQGQTRPPDEIIVVDNGSTDGTAEAIGARATVIRLPENRGFAHAVNQGIAAARGEWVGILNNDVEPEADWLQLLLLSDKDFSLGKLVTYSDSSQLDGTFDLLSRVAMPWRAGSGRRDQAILKDKSSIKFASWTAVLYRRQVLERVGPLDEAFGSYYEDVDFGIRSALAGVVGSYEPRAVARHIGSATLGAWRSATVRLLTRNHRLLINKHFGDELDWQTTCRLFASRFLWALLAIRHGQGRAWLAGAFEKLPVVVGLAHDRVALGEILAESEQELYRLQKETGFDWYWRMYFGLFPPR